MKRRFLILPALCMGLLFSSCDNDRRTAQGDGYEQTETEEGYGDDTEYGVETDRTSAPGSDMDMDDRREFVEETHSTSRMEVEMAQLAQQRAQHEDVKSFAQRMENDHNEANNHLNNMAQQENIQMSQTMEDDRRDDLDDLREKEGSDFDEAYLDKTIDNHETLIDKFEDIRDNNGNAQNQEMSSWIDTRLQTLREHRDEAERIKERIGGNDGVLNN